MKDILAALISMRTFSHEVEVNEAALDYIEAFLHDRGMSCKRFVFDGHGSLMATTQGERKNPAVILYAHVDVLEGPSEAFTLRSEKGTLYGRGVIDMKFAIAAYMQLVDDFQDKLDDYDFGIMITTDEEIGGLSVPHILREGYTAQMCVLPDGGDDWKLERLAKGVWRFTLVAEGKNAHGSRPWEGDSASFKLIQALHDIKQLFEDHGPKTDTLNIGIIEGGVAFNQIPDSMTAAVEIRLATQGSYKMLLEKIEAICRKRGVIIKSRQHTPPTVHDLTHPLIREFQASIQAITGTSPGNCLSFGQSDATHFMEAGIPCALTRPPGGGPHGDEWLSEKAFMQLPKVLEHYIRSLHAQKVTQTTPGLVSQNRPLH